MPARWKNKNLLFVNAKEQGKKEFTVLLILCFLQMIKKINKGTNTKRKKNDQMRMRGAWRARMMDRDNLITTYSSQPIESYQLIDYVRRNLQGAWVG